MAKRKPTKKGKRIAAPRRKKATAPRVIDSRFARGKGTKPGKSARSLAARKESEKLVKTYIKELREVYSGYEAKDGYSLTGELRLHPSKLRKVIKEAQNLREMTQRPHLIVDQPKDTGERKELAKVTGMRGKHVKRHIVHVDDPKKSSVKFVDGKVEIRTRVKGRATVADRYYWFPHWPKSWDDIEHMTHSLLPTMPNGYYVVMNSQHGDVGLGAHKSALLRVMQRWAVEYDDPSKAGFAKSILGFRYTAESAAKHDQYLKERSTARARHEERIYAERDARTGSGKLQCPMCERQYATRVALRRHKDTEHKLTKRARATGRR